MATFMAEVDVTPKEYINELSSNEKKELFELLAKNLKENVDDELEMIKNKEKDKQATSYSYRILARPFGVRT